MSSRIQPVFSRFWKNEHSFEPYRSLVVARLLGDRRLDQIRSDRADGRRGC
jgi:hypothetical protein